VNDAFVEGPETATMTITAGTQYTGTPNTTLTIADNDTATVTITSSGAPNETGPVNGTYTVTVTPQPQNAMSVNLSLSGAAQFGAGFDYTIAGRGYHYACRRLRPVGWHRGHSGWRRRKRGREHHADYAG
jgi:hypothetical protein